MTQIKQAVLGPYDIPQHPQTDVDYAAHGRALFNTLLAGGALGGGAAALYQLVNGVRKADPLSLVRSSVPSAEKKEKEEEKIATGPLDSLFANLGRAVSNFPYNVIGTMPGSSASGTSTGHPAGSAWQAGALDAGMLGAGALGAFGGTSLVNSLTAGNKKKDLAAKVEDARKEYFEALTGKTAATLDRIYDKLEKTASPEQPTWVDFLQNIPSYIYRSGQDTARLATAGSLAVGGASALLGGQYMYDQTKSRTRAETARKAQAARARLRGIQSTPQIDPNEFAALHSNR